MGLRETLKEILLEAEPETGSAWDCKTAKVARALLAVLDLHTRGSLSSMCRECQDEWPCPTVQEIQREMGEV